jgi:hypothetical protein
MADPRHRIGTSAGCPITQFGAEAAGFDPVPTDPAFRTGGRVVREFWRLRAVRYPCRTLLAAIPAAEARHCGSYSWQMNAIARLRCSSAASGTVPYHPKKPCPSLRRSEFSRPGAYAGFEEKTRGTLEVGKLADLVVLSMDPLSIAPDQLKDLRIDLTILDGAVRYERPR